MLLAGVVAAVALLVLIGVALQFTGGPAPTGLLVIDAVPWARVTAIEASDGRSMPLPDATSTPLKLSLPAGTYKITLTGPGSDTKEVQAAVEVDGLSLAQPAMFSTISVDEYFERYLGPPDTAEPATAATPTAPSAASSSGSRP
jgi:hypothetical protein